jgi:hypothetical protein
MYVCRLFCSGIGRSSRTGFAVLLIPAFASPADHVRALDAGPEWDYLLDQELVATAPTHLIIKSGVRPTERFNRHRSEYNRCLNDFEEQHCASEKRTVVDGEARLKYYGIWWHLQVELVGKVEVKCNGIMDYIPFQCSLTDSQVAELGRMVTAPPPTSEQLASQPTGGLFSPPPGSRPTSSATFSLSRSTTTTCCPRA